ncbi:hypothetical protein [Pseudomonas syringae]|uniref:hypothetical protein n=1 Tax=Pseudomonas syringae TaxID=317 RepID=UPI001F43A128|nr:hypothetical protein [Pseudomonas syringae]MBL3831536.1 hypothetical protein [Pseudomonas syringae pv. theae]MBL3833156.1 hypothetical protein [Pseudomonas syringae pv. theae]GKQ45089.1 hypothetical protein PSTH2693_08055 [Pseudomonas syringae pv. theae]
MTIYEETLEAIKAFKTPKAHITSLGKILNKTEDKELKKYLIVVIRLLSAFAVKPKSSTPISLTQRNDVEEVVNLVKYLMPFIPKKQPEWQVIALREGWTPPKS